MSSTLTKQMRQAVIQGNSRRKNVCFFVITVHGGHKSLGHVQELSKVIER
jgi:hypothetical protein